MAVTATSNAVHHTEVDDFLRELREDLEAGEVAGNVVRLAQVEGIVTVGMTEPDRGWDQRPLPTSVARGHFLEAAYTNGLGQLAKLSRFVGWTWERVEDEAEAAHNEETRERASRQFRRLQAGLHSMKGLTVRGGGLYVDDGSDWRAFPEQRIAQPPPERCRICDEAIHYANNVWRHTATNRAEALREVPCGCDHGSVRVAGRQQMHAACGGSGMRKVEDHLATPAEVAEEVEA